MHHLFIDFRKLQLLLPLKLINTNLDGNRETGKPKARRKDVIESDLKELRVIGERCWCGIGPIGEEC